MSNHTVQYFLIKNGLNFGKMIEKSKKINIFAKNLGLLLKL